MVDKPQTPSRNKIGAVIGRLDDATMIAVHRALAVFLGLAEPPRLSGGNAPPPPH